MALTPMKMSLEPRRFGPGQRERQEDRVAGRHVRNRDLGLQILDSVVVGHGHVAVSADPPKDAEVDVHDHVGLHVHGLGHLPGGGDLDVMALPIAKAERVRPVAL